uniref:Uncharacterized protein n=1 Tax=Angiostrongylus cantonensis TaxID=6313 RepID=A0A0K0DMR8_ANGCA
MTCHDVYCGDPIISCIRSVFLSFAVYNGFRRFQVLLYIMFEDFVLFVKVVTGDSRTKAFPRGLEESVVAEIELAPLLLD